MSKLSPTAKDAALKILSDSRPREAIRVSSLVERLTGERYDWHEYGFYFEELTRKGALACRCGEGDDGHDLYQMAAK